MDVFDNLITGVTSETGGGDSHSAMATAVLGMLNSQGSGGLPALVQSFEKQGLGDMIGKWISTGPNPPVSPDQVHAALGADKVQQLAQQGRGIARPGQEPYRSRSTRAHRSDDPGGSAAPAILAARCGPRPPQGQAVLSGDRSALS